jgi:CBS domain-containing protein
MQQVTIRQLLEVKGHDVWTVSPDTSVYDFLRMMSDKDVGALVVMEGEKMVGIVSERDYARKVVLLGKTSHTTKVGEIMSSRIISVHPDQTVEEAMEILSNKHIRHLPVVDDEDKLTGMITHRDVMRAIIHKQRMAIRDMEEKILR